MCIHGFVVYIGERIQLSFGNAAGTNETDEVTLARTACANHELALTWCGVCAGRYRKRYEDASVYQSLLEGAFRDTSRTTETASVVSVGQAASNASCIRVMR